MENEGFSLLKGWCSAKAVNPIFPYMLGGLLCQLQLSASELTHLPRIGFIKMIQQFSSQGRVP